MDGLQVTTAEQVWGVFMLGIVVWTFIEYTVHRFVFHIDALLPNHPKAFVAHFLLHGVHHYLPMDKYVPMSLLSSRLAYSFIHSISRIGIAW